LTITKQCLQPNENFEGPVDQENYGVAVPECLTGFYIPEDCPVVYDRWGERYYVITHNGVIILDKDAYLNHGIKRAYGYPGYR